VGEPRRDSQRAPAPDHDLRARPRLIISIRTGLPQAFDPTPLLRPIALDNIAIESPGWSTSVLGQLGNCGDSLAEGGACTWWGTGDRIAGPIVIEGMVWGTKLSRVVTPDRAFAASVARDVLEQCVADAIWDTTIAVPADVSHRTSHVSFGGR
jgi:hypothetical protein